MMRVDELWGVVLTGIEGSGKTRLARIAAERLGWATLDADDLMDQIAGLPLHEARRKADAAALARRADAVRNALLSQPSHRMILATTLRAVQDAPADLRDTLSTVLREHWVVIHIENDLVHVADYFVAHPGARQTRQRLDGVTRHRDIYDRLVEMRNELDPFYALVRNDIVFVANVEDGEAVARILASVLCRIAPAAEPPADSPAV